MQKCYRKSASSFKNLMKKPFDEKPFDEKPFDEKPFDEKPLQ
jgi:hypothetical protein